MWDGATLEVCAKVDATTIDISRGGGGVFGGSPYGEETPIMEVSSFEGRILGSGGENILQNRISKFILSDNEPRANKSNYFWDKWYPLHQWSLYLWNGIFLLDARTKSCWMLSLFPFPPPLIDWMVKSPLWVHVSFVSRFVSLGFFQTSLKSSKYCWNSTLAFVLVSTSSGSTPFLLWKLMIGNLWQILLG